MERLIWLIVFASIAACFAYVAGFVAGLRAERHRLAMLLLHEHGERCHRFNEGLAKAGRN